MILKASAALVISLFVMGSASCVLLVPVFPMVTIPNVCITEIDCVGYASLSCVIFGVGGLDFGSHYYLSAGGDCHLTEQQAGISSVTTNTTVTSNLGDD